MSLLLDRVEDPRDRLTKARKMELVRYAQANGMNHITDQMPALIIRAELRKKGLVNPDIANRVLGQPEPRFGDAPMPQPGAEHGGIEMDAEADLMRQWQAQTGAYTSAEVNDPVEEAEAEAAPVVSIHKPSNIQEIAWLRKECKQRNVKITRQDTVQTMKHKLGAMGVIVDG